MTHDTAQADYLDALARRAWSAMHAEADVAEANRLYARWRNLKDRVAALRGQGGA